MAPLNRPVRALGWTEVGRRFVVALPDEDARYHTHMPGVTGTGKSTAIANMFLADARAGRGAALLDPKGDMANDVLARLPEHAAGRLVLIDPDERDAPAALNILDGPDKELAAEQVVTIFRKVYASSWGPRMDDILRCACLTLARVPDATLADIPALLTEPGVRAALAGLVSGDQYLRGFWHWYESMNEFQQASAAGPVLSRLRMVLTRRFAADTLGCARSSFSMGKVLDGGLLIARLPKGLIGDDTTRLVGSLIIAQAWQAALARARIPEDARRDATLYLDECANFLHFPGALEDVLSEARGYRLALVLAHQHLGQFPRELASAVSANARNKMCFTLSPEDARVLARQMGPVLTETDLSHLGRYQAACRLVAGGADTPGFTVRTLPLPPPVPGRAGRMRAAAAASYGRTVEARRADEIQRRIPALSRGVSGSVSGSDSGSVLKTPPETPPPDGPSLQAPRGFLREPGDPDSRYIP